MRGAEKKSQSILLLSTCCMVLALFQLRTLAGWHVVGSLAAEDLGGLVLFFAHVLLF
jgi:hypothetical protein